MYPMKLSIGIQLLALGSDIPLQFPALSLCKRNFFSSSFLSLCFCFLLLFFFLHTLFFSSFLLNRCNSPFLVPMPYERLSAVCPSLFFAVRSAPCS